MHTKRNFIVKLFLKDQKFMQRALLTERQMKTTFPLISLTSCLIISLLPSCKSTLNKNSSLNTEPTSSSNLEKPLKPISLLSLGVDYNWSESSDEIYFSLNDQRSHSLYQIYSYNVLTEKILRLTHDDGNSRYPFSVSSDEFLYSSDTDEKKENLAALLKEDSNAFGQEIYLRHRNEDLSDRLTASVGTEILPRMNPSNRDLFFFRKKNNQWAFVKKAHKNLNESVVQIFKELPTALVPSANFSHWFWLEDGQIKFTKGAPKLPEKILSAKVQTLQASQIRSVFFYSTKDEPNVIQLLNWKTGCSSVIFKLDSKSLQSFLISPDHQKVLLVVNAPSSNIKSTVIQSLNDSSELCP